jgi:hypothetical protein
LYPSTPTFFPNDTNKNPSTIDLVLTNGMHSYSDLTTVSMDSDHCAVKLDIILNKRILMENPSLVPSFKNANWEKYRDILNQKLSRPNYQNASAECITSTQQIDGLVEDFSELLSHAQNLSVPMVHPDHYAVKLTPDIEEAIKVRNLLKRRWQRQRDPNLKYLINYCNKFIRKKISELENINWNHRLENVDNNNDLWKVTKLIKSKHNLLPPIKINNKILITPAEKSNAFADYFEECHKNPLETNTPKFTEKIESSVNEYLLNVPEDTEIDYPSPEETNAYIKNQKKTKAPGLDRIHAETTSMDCNRIFQFYNLLLYQTLLLSG